MGAPGRERVLFIVAHTWLGLGLGLGLASGLGLGFIVAHTEKWPSRARPPCADGCSRSAKMPSDRKVSGLRKRCFSRPG